MKNLKTILLAALITTGVFSVAVFTACTKVNCNNVICQNGGSCANGVCSCPTGFSGTNCEVAALTVIKYTNNTFTPISITVNGKEGSIPVGGSISYTGKVNNAASGTAFTTAGANSLGTNVPGGLLGVLINWQISNSFPATDTLKVPLDVGSTYFFLRVANKHSLDIIDYNVNYQFSYGEVYGDVTIPKNGITYDLGYYLAYQQSTVHVQFTNSTGTTYPVTLPFTNNQIFTLTVN